MPVTVDFVAFSKSQDSCVRRGSECVHISYQGLGARALLDVHCCGYDPCTK